jgi:hypothetical protein
MRWTASKIALVGRGFISFISCLPPVFQPARTSCAFAQTYCRRSAFPGRRSGSKACPTGFPSRRSWPSALHQRSTEENMLMTASSPPCFLCIQPGMNLPDILPDLRHRRRAGEGHSVRR